jgi:site-specific recombinase XerD
MDAPTHPDFEVLGTSWQLALEADGYAPNSVAAYRLAVAQLARFLAATHPGVGPADLDRDHVRGWLAHVRTASSSSTARTWFSGVRHFCRFLVAEGEADRDATEGVKTPKAGEPSTPVLQPADIRAMLDTCAGADFTSRRDAAVVMVLADGGLRLAELAGLKTSSIDLQDRMLFVQGKGTQRRGPRHRAVPLGVKAARALDRYLRVRRRHPYAATEPLWLGTGGRATISADGIDAMLKRRAAKAGLQGVHPHMFRHSWASAFRAAGGSEGDLLVLGGWRSRAMLDRYGKAAAADRAAESYRRLSLGDRL